MQKRINIFSLDVFPHMGEEERSKVGAGKLMGVGVKCTVQQVEYLHIILRNTMCQIWSNDISAQHPTYLFQSHMISDLGLPSALQVKYMVFPEVTSASCGSDIILGLSVPNKEMETLLVLKCQVKLKKIKKANSSCSKEHKCPKAYL